MQAIVVTGPDNYSLEKNVPKPKVTPNGVVVRTRATGVCGTDLEILSGHMGYFREGLSKYPIIPGHEWAGEVVEMGSAVKGFNIGDHVVGETTVPCFNCDFCSKGMVTICPSRIEIGVLNHNGGFANFLLYPNYRTLHKIHNKIPFPSAAAVEPLSIAVAGVKSSPLRNGDCVVIMGDGAIGLYLLQVCQVKGASTVIVVGGVENRLRKAEELGASATINALTSKDLSKHLKDLLKKLNHGKLANIVIEATGNPKAVDTALDIVEPGGHITLLGLGFAGKKADLDLDKVVLKNLSIKGSLSSSGAMWPETIALIESGKVDPAKIISHKFPLEKFSLAVETLDKKLDNVLKVVIVQDNVSKL